MIYLMNWRVWTAIGLLALLTGTKWLCEWMRYFCSSIVRKASKFCAIKTSDPTSSFIDSDRCNPLSATRSVVNTLIPRGVVYLLWPVLRIFGLTRNSQVAYSIVRFIPVNVINFTIRPASVHIKPSKSVKETIYPIDAHLFIPGASIETSNWSVKSESLASYFPCKHARFRVVISEFLQTLCGKIGLSHDTVPSLIGQRPVSVTSTGGLRYFTLKG